MFDCITCLKHILEILPPSPLRAREGHIQQSNLTTPKMFGTKIRIESQMFDCKHILEILHSTPPPLRAREGHRQQSNLITPKMFGTKIRIESEMFDCKPIL